jgi:hypothetical protein
MALNSVKPTGDDQQWKREVEIIIQDLQNRLNVAEQQLNNIIKKVN